MGFCHAFRLFNLKITFAMTNTKKPTTTMTGNWGKCPTFNTSDWLGCFESSLQIRANGRHSVPTHPFTSTHSLSHFGWLAVACAAITEAHVVIKAHRNHFKCNTYYLGNRKLSLTALNVCQQQSVNQPACQTVIHSERQSVFQSVC